MQKSKTLPILNYQALFQSLPAMYLILTTDFHIITVNDAHSQATLTKPEDAIGRLVFDVFPDNPSNPTGLADLKASLTRVVRTRKSDVMPLVKYDVSKPGSDGEFEERYWLINNTPVLDDNGEILYIINSADEVTDFVRLNQQIKVQNEEDEEARQRLKKMEAEVYYRSLEVTDINKKVIAEREKLIQELTKSNQELERFAYAAAHDLKSPLNSIANLAKWMEEDLGDAIGDSKEHMLKLRQQVQRMQKLLDDLLEYSRVEQKLNYDQTKIISGEELIKNILPLLMVPKSFNVKLSDDFKALKIQKMPLQQIFFNLIQNAIKHHGQIDGIIEIDVKDEGSKYIFSVADDGQGIAPEYHQKIFEMFQTLAPRFYKEGTGMGLALVKKLVLANGGDIKVESKLGQGASFIFTWLKDLNSKGAKNAYNG